MSKPRQIWQVKGPGPAVAIHDDRLTAENEAHRLAKMNPDHVFYVMEAVAMHRCVATERIAFDACDVDGSLPF